MGVCDDDRRGYHGELPHSSPEFEGDCELFVTGEQGCGDPVDALAIGRHHTQPKYRYLIWGNPHLRKNNLTPLSLSDHYQAFIIQSLPGPHYPIIIRPSLSDHYPALIIRSLSGPHYPIIIRPSLSNHYPALIIQSLSGPHYPIIIRPLIIRSLSGPHYPIIIRPSLSDHYPALIIRSLSSPHYPIIIRPSLSDQWGKIMWTTNFLGNN